MVWFSKASRLSNTQEDATRMSGIDFVFSGQDRDRAFTAFSFDKTYDNKSSACFLTQKC
jgi:hypothetical protein